jgi:hypothetical protein
MGFLNDDLPPNVYIFGSPQVNDGYERTMHGLDIAMGAANALSGRQVGASTLGGALASAAWSEVLGMDMHWCQIDLNNYTIGIDGSPMRPLADITYAEIRMPDAFLFGFAPNHWMGVTANQLPQPHRQVLKYILPFTGLPADSYVINPAEPNLAYISKSHAIAYVDHFYPAE